MSLTFVQPLFALLLLAVPALWLVPPRPRSAVHGTLRSLVFALIIAALAQPVALTPLAARRHVFVVDQSASLSPDARRTATDVARRLAARADGDVSIITMGDADIGNAAIALPADAGSPLSDALALAARSIPMGVRGSVSLISDGLSTDRNWGSAVTQLIERGVPVNTYDLGMTFDDPALVGLDIADARPGEAVRVTARVAGVGEDLRVRVARGDETLTESEPFDSDGRRGVTLEFEAEEPGFADVVVTLEAPGDPDLANNALAGVVAVQEPIHALYLGARQIGAPAEAQHLFGAGVKVDAVDPGTIDGAADLSRYDIVLLDDLPADALSTEGQAAIARAVKDDGLGLLYSGGEAAFGEGGYDATAIADVLPVSLSTEEDRIDPSVGLAIIIDTSGSMAGSRIELARQIARIAARRLQPHDRVGIVEFYGAKHWAIPMQPATNLIEIERAIGRMQALGGTILYPAIQEGYYGLMNVSTRYKHMLIITDAGVEDEDYETMLRSIARDNINVSTVLVGAQGHNMMLSDLANWGRGRFYSVADPFQLVELIFKEPTTNKPSPYRRGDFAVEALGGSGWWGSVDRAATPHLAGYVALEPRDGAETLLRVTEGRKPVLSSWRYGLGRVTALMTEPFGAGTAPWANWSGYGELLSRVIARTADDALGLDLDLVRHGGRLTLTARAPGAGPDDVSAALVDAAGDPVDGGADIRFVERAPGLFDADFAAPLDAAVRIVATRADTGDVRRVGRAAASDRVAETQVDPSRALDLDALAARTGGLALGALAPSDWRLAADAGEDAFDVTRLWPLLLLAALAAYLADLMYRRRPLRRSRPS